MHGQSLSPLKCTYLSKYPVHLQLADLQDLLSTVSQLHLCAGHPDQQFVDMVEARKGKLFKSSGEVAAFVDRSSQITLHGQIYHATVRTAVCQLLTSSVKCPQCVSYRDTIRSIHHR